MRVLSQSTGTPMAKRFQSHLAMKDEAHQDLTAGDGFSFYVKCALAENAEEPKWLIVS
jgi:hypothetical protein